MPLITVAMYPGRSPEQKSDFAKAVTEAAVQILKTKAEHVIIVFEENPKENWFQTGKPL
ncbi:MAG TPA: tautomerase family protein [Nitrososphaera sp.]|jgi:4-oxalocrotonate tautomerase|nr:tautomerase family protein [Nitrososphaera sp.]